VLSVPEHEPRRSRPCSNGEAPEVVLRHAIRGAMIRGRSPSPRDVVLRVAIPAGVLGCLVVSVLALSSRLPDTGRDPSARADGSWRQA